MYHALKYIKPSGSSIKLHPSFFYYFLLFFHILVLTRVWANSILFSVILLLEDVYFAAIILYLVYKVIYRIQQRNYAFTFFHIYLLVPIIINIQVAITTHFNFGQPFLIGLIPMSDLWLFYGCLFIYDLVKSGRISMDVVEDAYLGVAWTSLVFFYAMSLLTNPAQYKATSLAAGNSVKGGSVYYGFNMTMMFFGSIYYFIKAFMQKKYYFLVHSALFIVYIVFFRFDRTVMAVTAASMGLFFVLYVSIRDQFLAIIRFGIPLLLLVITGALVFPDVYETYVLMFQDIYATLTGNEVDIGKESVRVYEMYVASKFLDDPMTYIVGCGKISQNWVEGGFNYFYGYFYPSDLGLIGMVFMFGIPGSILLYSQFFMALFYVVKTKLAKTNVFYLSLVFYLFTMFLDCLTNAYVMTYAAQTMIVVSLLYFYYQEDEKKRVESKNSAA